MVRTVEKPPFNPCLAASGAAVQVVLALAVALVAAPMVRNVTSALNDSAGRIWPFSLEHCPAGVRGCRAEPPQLARADATLETPGRR